MDFLSPIRFFFRAVASYPVWQIVVELLVIGAAMYAVVRFLRGTLAANMLRGIAVVLVTLYVLLHLVAGEVGLSRISFLYNKFVQYAFYAIIVVFQPELRRGLLKLGETRLFRRISGGSGELGQRVDALCEAAQFCARRKIGAVVAIERDVSLAGVAENGTLVNADLTAPLLDTIFWPNSPLHDLGVVISNGRIMWAGVQFPMAESGDLEKELGARHRAAVGMSQESDAVVLVVSEETGDVSIAERGQLIRKLTPDALRDLLVELLGGSGGAAADQDGGGKKVDGRREAA